MAYSLKKRITFIVIFALAMAYLEATVVVYLRKIFEPHLMLLTTEVIDKKEVVFSLGVVSFLKQTAAIKLIPDAKIVLIEQFREIATIIIILTVSLLAAKQRLRKFAFFLLAFGLWDIYYYIFLYFFIGWPKNLFEIDVLFLIPLLWLAPVILPISVSLAMIVASYFLFRKS
jgi:hypothetical protein